MVVWTNVITILKKASAVQQVEITSQGTKPCNCKMSVYLFFQGENILLSHMLAILNRSKGLNLFKKE